jgi:hypothetical protein
MEARPNDGSKIVCMLAKQFNFLQLLHFLLGIS